VFGVVGHVTIGFKCTFVFIEPLYEASASLTYIHLVAVRVCQFVCLGSRVFVRGLLFDINSFWMLLLVRSAIVSFVFLNTFVKNVVFLSVYVKETHFCMALFICLSDVVVGCLWVGVLCVWIGKPLFSIML